VTALESAFAVNSPRLTSRGAALPGWVIHIGVVAADTVQPIYGLTALVVLIVLVLRGNAAVLVPVGAIVLAKLVLDLLAYVWAIHLYRRLTGAVANTHFGAALLSALVEPFTFIPLLHTGALLGWWQFLTGGQTWVPQRRNGIRGERG